MFSVEVENVKLPSVRWVSSRLEIASYTLRRFSPSTLWKITSKQHRLMQAAYRS